MGDTGIVGGGTFHAHFLQLIPQIGEKAIHAARSERLRRRGTSGETG
jgi:hypothetical protein